MLRLSGLSQQQTHLLSADGFQTQRNASTLILHVKLKPLRVAELCTYKMKLWTSSRYNRKRVLSMAIKGQYFPMHSGDVERSDSHNSVDIY